MACVQTTYTVTSIFVTRI